MESQPSVPSAAVAANANVTIKNEEEQDQAKQASNQLENTEIIEEAVEQVFNECYKDTDPFDKNP